MATDPKGSPVAFLSIKFTHYSCKRRARLFRPNSSKGKLGCTYFRRKPRGKNDLQFYVSYCRKGSSVAVCTAKPATSSSGSILRYNIIHATFVPRCPIGRGAPPDAAATPKRRRSQMGTESNTETDVGLGRLARQAHAVLRPFACFCDSTRGRSARHRRYQIVVFTAG